MRNHAFESLVLGTYLASCSLLADASPSTAARLSDAQVIGIYIQVNGFDIETALLGRTQGSSSAVRQLAQHVASDHIGVRQAAYGLAVSCNVSPTLTSDRGAAAIEHTKAMSKLLALEGRAFDLAYLQHEIAFHAAAIEAVKTVFLASSTCLQLQAHLKQGLPAFEHHLEETRALIAKIDTSSE